MDRTVADPDINELKSWTNKTCDCGLYRQKTSCELRYIKPSAFDISITFLAFSAIQQTIKALLLQPIPLITFRTARIRQFQIVRIDNK